jgi:hypothetical protein
MRELVGNKVKIFYQELDGRTFKKEGVILAVEEGLLCLEDIKEGKIIIPISRIGKFEVLP